MVLGRTRRQRCVKALVLHLVADLSVPSFLSLQTQLLELCLSLLCVASHVQNPSPELSREWRCATFNPMDQAKAYIFTVWEINEFYPRKCLCQRLGSAERHSSAHLSFPAKKKKSSLKKPTPSKSVNTIQGRPQSAIS